MEPICQMYLYNNLICKEDMIVKGTLGLFLAVIIHTAFVNTNVLDTLQTPAVFNIFSKARRPISTLTLTDIQLLQQILEGVFSENKMQGPYMIKYCFDDKIAHQTVIFLGDALTRAAKGSAKDLVQLISQAKSFYQTLPWPFIECLGKCQEIRSLGWKYEIDASTDFHALEIKLTEYVLLHYLEVHRWAVDLNQRWLGQYYFDVGYYGAMYGHKVQHGSTLSAK